MNNMSTKLSPVQQLQTMLSGNKKRIQNFLGTEEEAMRFQSAVMQCIDKTPKLLECDPASVFQAFLECAALKLYPSNYSGECYVLPYGPKAQFQLGYKGIKELAYRSGVRRCGTEVVYSNDDFRQSLGTRQELHHVPATGDRGKAIGAYAWAEVNHGSIVFQYMSEKEILAIKDLSKAKDKLDSPWNSKQDPQKWMWQKTVFKQLAKMMPTNDALSRAIHLDNVSERGGGFDRDGVLVEEAFTPKTREEKIDAGLDAKQAMREKQLNQTTNENPLPKQ